MVNTQFDIGEGRLYLHVIDEPIQTFYKDEGGKSNNLKCSCLVSFTANRNRSDYTHSNNDDISSEPPVPIGNLKIKPVLVYENGDPVEDASDIFNLVKVDPKTLTSTNETFTAWFRIEKVSRRKDGRKFRLQFNLDKESSSLLNYVSANWSTAEASQPINVLSKRKSNVKKHSEVKFDEGPHSRSRNQPKLAKLGEARFRESLERLTDLHIGEEPTKRKEKSILVPETILMKVLQSNAELERVVMSLTKRLALVEAELGKRPDSKPAVERRRLHSLETFDQSDLRSGIPRSNSSAAELFDFLQTSSFLN